MNAYDLGYADGINGNAADIPAAYAALQIEYPGTAISGWLAGRCYTNGYADGQAAR